MFVSTARVRLVGMPNRDKKKKELSKRKRALRKNLKLRDLLRMPCLLPTCASCLLGFLVLMGGTAMSVVAYHPAFDNPYASRYNETQNITTPQGLRAWYLQYALHRPTAMKILSYIGPIFMGFGLFTMIVAGVLYCEFVDKYVTISTDKQRSLKRKVLYQMIIEQLRRNYFRGLEIPTRRPTIPNIAPKVVQAPLSRCLSISSPVLCPLPDIDPGKRPTDSPETAQSPTKHKSRLKVLQREHWIKTTSLPNIKPDVGVGDRLEVLCSSTEKYLMTKRLSKSCGNVVDMCSITGSYSSRVTSSGFDNLAYTPDQEAYTPDQEAGQLAASGDVVSQSSLHSRMTSREPSSENLCTQGTNRDESEINKTSNTDVLVDVDTDEEDDNCSNSNNQLFFTDECDAPLPKGKHATVIVHQAYVHQSAEACDLNNMQITNEKLLYDCPEVRDSNDANKRDISTVIDEKDLSESGDDVSQPLMLNHVTICFDDTSSISSESASQSDDDDGDSVDLCKSKLL
ncbi:uncharacterized protein LOC121375532 [Gigantopelta aegis]|uniref:uncharacterized protein LOC121375532 n=1 Tax=Gigantopelta aegis TaxID=1735272 RepID=UPI001B88C352|nr:uncharacterized protein LOC121375532 [Gigantopelta aegis]